MTKSHPGLSRPLSQVIQILGIDLNNNIEARIKTNPNVSILDLGCGVGRSLWDLSSKFSALSQQKIQLFGLWYNEENQENPGFNQNFLRQKAATENPKIIAEEFKIPTQDIVAPKLFCQDACQGIPQNNESIDLIYSSNAFHFFTDKIKALQEISRILKINGESFINIDRTDEGFWPNDLFFPRLQIHQEDKITNTKLYLENKSNNNFSLNIKVHSPEQNNKKLYILHLKKHKTGQINFSDLNYNPIESFPLENIRSGENEIQQIPEFQKLIDSNILFQKKPLKEYFGGFLSIYNSL